MTVALVDDAILGTILRGAPPAEIADGAEVFTTGCWYVRLCQAVLRGDEARGQLSRPFHDQPPGLRERALDAALVLPPTVGLVSMRELGRSMGRLRRSAALNLLGVEALAAAAHLEAVVHLSVPSPPLQRELADRGIRCEVHDRT